MTEISKKTKHKIKRREDKRKPKMKVSGKRVFQLKKIIKDKWDFL